MLAGRPSDDNALNATRTGLPVSNEPPALFRDIHPGHWAYPSVMRAVEYELFSGVGGGRFAPDEGMTRAMFVTVLGRMARQMGVFTHHSGFFPFHDVPVDAWYSVYVVWAWNVGITQGISETLFGTNETITREQAATFFYRFMQRYEIELPGNGETGFPDMDTVSGWALEAILEAVRTGLITGHANGNLAPRETATRAQVAVMFLRLIDAVQALPDMEDEPEYAPEDESESAEPDAA